MHPGKYGKIGIKMTNSFKNVYKNKKVLVTGHTGFKGSWLTLWLTELGAEVIGYSLEPNTNPNLFEVLNLKEKTHHIIGDIRDQEKLSQVFKKQKPDMVFHMAAQPLVRYSYKEPKLTFETNIIGTINLFEAARAVDSVRVLVNITSDKCYDNKERLEGYKETDPMGGYDPYSASKGAAEIITGSYRNSFFNPKDYGKIHNLALASVRAGNVIGGGDWSEDRLIPDCIRSLINKGTIVIRNPNAIRPWQYALEPLSGYLWLGSLMWQDGISYSEGWNFGPKDDKPLTVGEIADKMVKLWGCGEYKINPDTTLHEAKYLNLSIEKAQKQLKWKPVYNIEEAINSTINWYSEFYNNKSGIEAYSMNQIKEYTAKANNYGIEWSL